MLQVVQLGEDVLKVLGQGAGKLHIFAAAGVVEAQQAGVQGLGIQIKMFARRAVERITHHRVLNVGKMDSDLVGAAG